MSPVEVVAQQTEAYNARDLQRFVAMYSEAVTVFRAPHAEPSIVGKAQLAAFYGAERFNKPGLRAEILNRMALGNKVIEHERVWGIGDSPMEVVAIYKVVGERIEQVLFITSD